MAESDAGAAAFEAKLNELMEAYRDVVWKSYQLPFFSLWPMLIFLGQYLIALFGLAVDIILLPYTLLALLLRLFNIRWRIIAPFWKRASYALVYINRGEWMGTLVMRPVVRWLTKYHVARRLRGLGELIATSEAFSPAARDRLGETVAKAQARFPVRDLQDFFKDSLIPALVFGAISFATDLVGDEEQKRVLRLSLYAIVAVIAIYAVSIVVSGFPVKRGLFLGRDVKHAAFPGGVKGQGLYALEREVFAAFPVRPREISLDMIFFIFSAAISPVYTLALAGVGLMGAAASADAEDAAASIVGQQVVQSAILIVVYVYMRIRRGMLKRN
jgi:hypothetical protein